MQHSYFVIHLARIVVSKLAFFKFLQEAVPQHILHRYSKEISQPSHFVN